MTIFFGDSDSVLSQVSGDKDIVLKLNTDDDTTKISMKSADGTELWYCKGDGSYSGAGSTLKYANLHWYSTQSAGDAVDCDTETNIFSLVTPTSDVNGFSYGSETITYSDNIFFMCSAVIGDNTNSLSLFTLRAKIDGSEVARARGRDISSGAQTTLTLCKIVTSGNELSFTLDGPNSGGNVGRIHSINCSVHSV